MWASPSRGVEEDLVGGFNRFNPSEKYARQVGFVFPKYRGENKKCLRPPTTSR